MSTYVSVLFAYLQALVRDEEGASAVEYGLILGLIAVAIVFVLLLMKDNLILLFQGANEGLGEAAGGAGGG
jgi:pilus assembly protein Flp/PilA